METLKKLFSRIKRLPYWWVIQGFLESVLLCLTLVVFHKALILINIPDLLILGAACIYFWNITKRIAKAILEIINRLLD